MTNAQTDFEVRLAQAAGDVESMLETWLSPTVADSEIARPSRLLAAMRHGALAGGKRLRPFLTIETARMLGGDAEQALVAACAIECLHCYSLVHDDLPAMDDDDLRRGRPTVHRAFDEATAILAGDALLTLAFEKMAHPACHPDAAVRAALIMGLARSGGLGGMVGGQMLDLEAEGRFGLASHDVRQTLLLQSMKTGALLAFAVEAGALLAGADEAAHECLYAYGRAFGAAFQIADDILDREADAQSLGKAVAKDQAKGKATLVDLMGLAEARAERDRLAALAAAALDDFGPAAEPLRQAALFAAGRHK